MEAQNIIPGLKDKALFKVIMSPEEFRSRINVDKHSFGGTAPILGQKNPPHRSPIEGLWYIGAYSENSGGLSGAVKGAWKTTKMILKEK
jgi:phytoene dehydrogenase-like protein